VKPDTGHWKSLVETRAKTQEFNWSNLSFFLFYCFFFFFIFTWIGFFRQFTEFVTRSIFIDTNDLKRRALTAGGCKMDWLGHTEKIQKSNFQSNDGLYCIFRHLYKINHSFLSKPAGTVYNTLLSIRNYASPGGSISSIKYTQNKMKHIL
jgi:hypothetical protein